MPKTLENIAKQYDVAEIVNHGEKLILPENMTVPNAIDLLQRRLEYLETKVALNETFDVFPWDGANAFADVLTAKYGWVPATSTPGFFSDNPPQMISIEVAHGKFKQVPWGAFNLPGIEGRLQTGTGYKNGRIVFALNATIKRKDEAAVQALFSECREQLAKHSIYRGQAIKLRFRDDDGDKLDMPEPKFLDTNDVDESMLVYSKHVMNSIQTNLFTPIERVQDCLANGIPVKRGVLLGGTYGTGKTLAAKAASKIAVRHGITYLYVPRADELAEAIDFAKQYQSPACVVFCEDIDRAMSGERDVNMDDILNVIDGIDTKSANIIVVLTTNDLNAINPAMLRPGRLDAVIEVTAPDAHAVQRLLRVYGGPAIMEGTDLTVIGQLLDGAIPAVVSEVVKRAKLAQLRQQPRGEMVSFLSEASLIEAAHTMRSQLDLLENAINGNAKTERTSLEKALTDVVATAIREADEADA